MSAFVALVSSKMKGSHIFYCSWWRRLTVLVFLQLVLILQYSQLVQSGPISGYILALKAIEVCDDDTPAHDEVSLFNISFNGSVDRLWKITLDSPHLLYDVSTFAVDADHHDLVYLPIIDQFMAVDLHTGAVKIQIPLKPSNLQYFITYDYSYEDGQLYGICKDNSSTNTSSTGSTNSTGTTDANDSSHCFGWCRVVNHDKTSVVVDVLYTLPLIKDCRHGGPTQYIYSIDMSQKTLMYYTSFVSSTAVGINITNGDVLFKGGASRQGTCVAYDPFLNKTFAIVENVVYESVQLIEVQHEPLGEKMLLQLPYFRIDSYGTCFYDSKTHTFVGVMGVMNANENWYHAMPTTLLLIDMIHVNFTTVSLPGFRESYESGNTITAVKFINK